MLAIANELVENGVTRVTEVDRVLGERLARPAPQPDAPAILVVDDDAVNRRLARTLLEKNGFSVIEAGDGRAALDAVQAHRNLSLVVLDLEMPRMTGLEALKELRRTMNTAGLPVVILTGADREDTEIELMDAGADDYLAKPFHMEELLARIRAQVRRLTGHARSEIEVGPLRLDTKTARVSMAGQPVKLTSHEYRLLAYLMHHNERVVSRTELVEHLYDQDFDRDSNTIEVFIGRLRRKIPSEMIKTVRGLGYRMGA